MCWNINSQKRLVNERKICTIKKIPSDTLGMRSVIVTTVRYYIKHDRCHNNYQQQQLYNYNKKSKCYCSSFCCSSAMNVTRVREDLSKLAKRNESATVVTHSAEMTTAQALKNDGINSISQNRINGHSSSSSTHCFNQIIEVLLAILLANCIMLCIMQVPLAAMALDSELNEDELSAYIFSGGSSHSKNAHAHYRYSERIDGSARGYDSNTLHHKDDSEFESSSHLQRSHNLKISPKPCSISHIEGTCMFVWECIKSKGRHIGMCVDSFMFGSCCAHNYTDNIVLPQVFSYTRPTKPIGIADMNYKPRPPASMVVSGMTTIERPHGAGTLVIRPSGPHHQGVLYRPQHTKPSIINSVSNNNYFPTTATTDDPNLISTSNSFPNGDIHSSSSSISTIWHTPLQPVSPVSQSLTSTTFHQQLHYQQHWHITTEPNFITKPRPPSWNHPLHVSSKPSKKPIISERPLPQQQEHHHTHQNLPSYQQTLSSAIDSATGTQSLSTISSNSQSQYTKPTQGPSTVMTPTLWTTNESTTTEISFTKPYKPTSSSTTITTVATSSSSFSLPTIAMMKDKPSITTVTKPASTLTTTLALNDILTTHSIIYRPQLTATTLRPTVSSSQSSVLEPSPWLSNAAAQNTTYTGQTLVPDHLTTIQSNEIPDTIFDVVYNNIGTIKTISAARSECGIPILARPETRIVGGKSAAFGRWPWQVSVRRTSFFGFSSTHRCGGALINENWIATAGHCVDDLLISQIRIRVGEYDFSHVQEQLPYIERAVVQKVVHPKYNFFTYEYDLALVKLEQQLEFAPHVSPICLPETDSLLIGMNATVTGWGRLSEGGTLPSVLQEVSVPIVSNDNCKTMFLRAGRQEFIPDIFLCAGYETGGQDSCQGDSGGPLQVKSDDGHFFLAGIISWGIGCAEANLPGVCTRISKFVPWILENVT